MQDGNLYSQNGDLTSSSSTTAPKEATPAIDEEVATKKQGIDANIPYYLVPASTSSATTFLQVHYNFQ